MNKQLTAVVVAMMITGTVSAAGPSLPGFSGPENINSNTNFNSATAGAAAGAAAGAIADVNNNINNSISNDVDLNNINANSNRLNNTQGQGQLQGQQQGIFGSGNSHQGQQQGISNSGNSNQGQDQSQSSSNSNSANQSQSANNSGNTQVTNYSNPKQYRNAPSMNSYMGTPGINCASVYSLAVSGPGLGIGGGFSGESDTCNRREAARVLNQMGEASTAMEVMCQDKMVSETTRCQEIRQHKIETVANRGNDTTDNNKVAKVTGNKVAAANTPNHVVLNGNVVEDVMTGKKYGYIRNGKFREINQVPFSYRDEINSLVISTTN